jgi:hypothetical protein
MKIQNGKLVYEVVKCNMCNAGPGKAKRGVHCKNFDRKQRGKPCEICGSKSRYDHKIVSHEIVDCYFCKQGFRQEDKFSNIPDDVKNEIIELTTFTFQTPDMRKISMDARFLIDCYSGKNSFAGSQDYTNHTKSDPELILAKVLKQVRNSSGMQALNYITDDNNLILDVNYFGFDGGWTANWAQVSN